MANRFQDELNKFVPVVTQKPSALSRMEGGSYYKLPIQPVTFAMTMGYDFCAASILKYLTRHRQKNGRQDILKARHFLELRAEIIRDQTLDRFLRVVRELFNSFGLKWVATGIVPRRAGHMNDMDVYIAANGFENAPEARALMALHYWATGVGGSHQSNLDSALQELLDEYDDVKTPSELAGMPFGGVPDTCEHDWLPHTDEGGQHLGNVCGKCGKVG